MKNRTLSPLVSLVLVCTVSAGALTACATDSGAPSEDEEPGAGDGGSGPMVTGSGGMASGGTGGTPLVATGGIVEVDPCAPQAGTLVPTITSISVTAPGGAAPIKGEPLVITISLTNSGTGVGPITVVPRIDSSRFSDYISVPAGSAEATLCADGAEVVIEAGPFLDHDALDKHYAVGSGDYTISSVEITENGTKTAHTDLGDTSFHVATSGALLVPVIYEQKYFDEITGLTTSTPEDYLAQSFTRSTQLFTPDSLSDADGPGSYQDYPGGFDEMMGVEHHFRSFSGFPGESVSDEGWCEDGMYYGEQVLGLATPWGNGHGTQDHRHGFDYLIALHSGLGGGVACWWLDVQISSWINRDVHRQQIIAVHESAHVFGAPHCDDIGNGEDGSLQGYVMCSGEVHPNYPENFVFHSESRLDMASVWN
jgi:hypothetical protein